MPTTALYVPQREAIDLLAERIKGLIARNKSVLIVAAKASSGVIFGRLQDRGVDIRRVFIVDAVQSGTAKPEADPDHVHFVSGPNLLELIAKRTERIIRTKAEGPAHVIVYDCDTFALYNPAPVLIELVRYIVQNLADPRMPIDFVIEQNSRMPASLQEFLNEFLDKEEHLGGQPPAAAQTGPANPGA